MFRIVLVLSLISFFISSCSDESNAVSEKKNERVA